MIHGTVAGEHFAEWMVAGIFFIGLEVLELGFALLAVYAWSRGGALLVIVTGLATVSIWLLSRTVGMPFGPAEFRAPEAVGAPDLASTLLESLSVLAAAAALLMFVWPGSGPLRAGAGRSWRGVLVAASFVLVALLLTAWGAVPTEHTTSADDHGAGAASSPQ